MSAKDYVLLKDLPNVTNKVVKVYGVIKWIDQLKDGTKRVRISDNTSSCHLQIDAKHSKLMRLEKGQVVRVHRGLYRSWHGSPEIIVTINKQGCHMVVWAEGELDPLNKLFITSHTYTSHDYDTYMLRYLNDNCDVERVADACQTQGYAFEDEMEHRASESVAQDANVSSLADENMEETSDSALAEDVAAAFRELAEKENPVVLTDTSNGIDGEAQAHCSTSGNNLKRRSTRSISSTSKSMENLASTTITIQNGAPKRRSLRNSIDKSLEPIINRPHDESRATEAWQESELSSEKITGSPTSKATTFDDRDNDDESGDLVQRLNRAVKRDMMMIHVNRMVDSFLKKYPDLFRYNDDQIGDELKDMFEKANAGDILLFDSFVPMDTDTFSGMKSSSIFLWELDCAACRQNSKPQSIRYLPRKTKTFCRDCSDLTTTPLKLNLRIRVPFAKTLSFGEVSLFFAVPIEHFKDLVPCNLFSTEILTKAYNIGNKAFEVWAKRAKEVIKEFISTRKVCLSKFQIVSIVPGQRMADLALQHTLFKLK